MSWTADDRAAMEAILSDPALAEIAREDMRAAQSERETAQLQTSVAASLAASLSAPVSCMPSEHTEQGLAKQFALCCGERLRYVPAWDWVVWDGKVWNRGAKEEARKMCMQYMDDLISEAFRASATNPGDPHITETLKWAIRIRTAKTIRSILELAAALLLDSTESFDSDPWLLNTQGGLVDLKTGDVRAHDPAARCTMICAADPTGAHGGDRWGDFLKAVTCEDAELEHYLQMLFGMAAVGKVYQEGLAIFFGGGSNGKSTLCNPVRAVFGSYATTIAPEILMSSRNRDEVRGLAALRGKRLAIASETEEGQRLSNSVVKRLSSTDKVNARELYKEAFDYIPTHTLIMFTNFLPRIGGTDDGIWRRIYAVPFNARFGGTGAKPIPNYGDVLLAENGADILHWVVEGARMFHAAGDSLPDTPECVKAATAEYRTSEDWIGNFLAECCEDDPGAQTPSGQLYTCYKVWAEGNGEYRRRVNDFAAAMEAAGYMKARTRSARCWCGVRIREELSAPGTYYA